MKRQERAGFTLIELSIVLVIIGLIVAGVLTGRDLIEAATIRSQINQIDKYQVAMETFRLKYGYLPGDIPDPRASSLGFKPRGTKPGQGDGNGILQSTISPPGNPSLGGVTGTFQEWGETPTFWTDLSSSGLMTETFSTVGPVTGIAPNGPGASFSIADTVTFNRVFPVAKLGKQNYVYVYSDTAGINFFGVSRLDQVWVIEEGEAQSTAGMTALQAFSIDTKVDDGKPQSGKIVAKLIADIGFSDIRPKWAYHPDPSQQEFDLGYYTWEGVAPGGQSPLTQYNCYDNANVAGASMQYSTNAITGNNLNCGLSFQFE